MSRAEKFVTLSEPSEGSYSEKNSKFLAFAFPVKSGEEIKSHLQVLRKAHPKANHHCYAWRLDADGLQYRTVDDGEPSGSAGRPILNAIDSAGLSGVLCVVVRYFGGVLLGVPGLIRAYGSAAAEALAAAAPVEKWITASYELHFGYPEMHEVLRLLRAAEAEILEQELHLFGRIRAAIPRGNTNVLKQLTDLRDVKLKPCTE